MRIRLLTIYTFFADLWRKAHYSVTENINHNEVVYFLSSEEIQMPTIQSYGNIDPAPLPNRLRVHREGPLGEMEELDGIDTHLYENQQANLRNPILRKLKKINLSIARMPVLQMAWRVYAIAIWTLPQPR